MIDQAVWRSNPAENKKLRDSLGNLFPITREKCDELFLAPPGPFQMLICESKRLMPGYRSLSGE